VRSGYRGAARGPCARRSCARGRSSRSRRRCTAMRCGDSCSRRCCSRRWWTAAWKRPSSLSWSAWRGQSAWTAPRWHVSRPRSPISTASTRTRWPRCGSRKRRRVCRTRSPPGSKLPYWTTSIGSSRRSARRASWASCWPRPPPEERYPGRRGRRSASSSSIWPRRSRRSPSSPPPEECCCCRSCSSCFRSTCCRAASPIRRPYPPCRSRGGNQADPKQRGPVPFGTGPQTALLEPFLRELADVLRLQSLRTFHHIELHLLALRKGAEAIGLDGRVVAEHVLTTAVLRDETEPLGIVEPLHSSSCHLRRHPSVKRPAEIAGPARRCRSGARRFLRSIARVVNLPDPPYPNAVSAFAREIGNFTP